MTYLGIGSPIPTLKALRETTVTLNYPVSSACEQDGIVTPSVKDPVGGTFSAPSGLTIDSSTGVITPGTSTVGTYTVSYTVSGVVGNFTFEIVADKASGFNYGGSILQQSGYATPTFNSGVQAGGTFTYTSSTGGTLSITQNPSSTDNGKIDLSNSSIGSYSISYASPGNCSTSTTISLDIIAAYASTSSFYFDGVNDYFDTGDLSVSGTNFSTSFWIKIDNQPSNLYSRQQVFPAHTSNGANYTIGHVTPRGRAAKRYLQLQGNDNNNVNPATYTTQNINLLGTGWNHVVFTHNITTTDTYAYVNGVAQTWTAFSGAPINVPFIKMAYTYSTFRIGAFNNTEFFEGYIDEVSVWNTVLSTDAITEIASGPNDLTTLTHANSSNLLAWYKMGE